MPPRIPRISAPAVPLLAPWLQPLPIRLPLLAPPALRFYSLRERERVKPSGPVFDEQIGANTIKYIDEHGEFQGEQSLRALLRRIPRHTHKIQCVGHEPILDEAGEQIDSIPICKLISKEDLAALQQKAYREKKEKKEAAKGKSSRNQKHVVKTLEFTWAISPHDLCHRLKKMQEFFEKGNRVEVTIGVKRGMKKMTLTEVRELARIVDEFALKFAKEMKEPEGDLGRKLMLFYESKVDVEKLEEKRLEEKKLEENKTEEEKMDDEKKPEETKTEAPKPVEGEPGAEELGVGEVLEQGSMTDAEYAAAQYAAVLRGGL